jgi:hypothetical protein
MQVIRHCLAKTLVDWHTAAMVWTPPRRRLIIMIIGIGFLTVLVMLLLLSTTNNPSPSSIPTKPIGTSTLSHGGPGPAP